MQGDYNQCVDVCLLKLMLKSAEASYGKVA